MTFTIEWFLDGHGRWLSAPFLPPLQAPPGSRHAFWQRADVQVALRERNLDAAFLQRAQTPGWSRPEYEFDQRLSWSPLVPRTRWA